MVVPPPLGSTLPFPPASIRGTMTETEAMWRQRAPVMAAGWMGGARGVAFREMVNTAGVGSSMEAAFFPHLNATNHKHQQNQLHSTKLE